MGYDYGVNKKEEFLKFSKLKKKNFSYLFSFFVSLQTYIESQFAMRKKMIWSQSIEVLSTGIDGISIKHPVFMNENGTNFLFRRSIPGVFSIFRYQNKKFSIDLSFLKKAYLTEGKKNISVISYLFSDLINYRKNIYGAECIYNINDSDIEEIKENILYAFNNWKNLFNTEDGKFETISYSDEKLTWYEAERIANDTNQDGYWINSTPLGINIEKRIIENVASRSPFRIAEEEQIWKVASDRYTDAAKGNVKVIF